MLSDRIKKLRKEKGLTQQELAKKLKIAQSTIASIESGRRNGNNDTIRSLAKFFDVSIDYLQGITDERNSLSKEKENLIDDFLNLLIKREIITDEDNIDESTQKMIMDIIRKEIGYKLHNKNS